MGMFNINNYSHLSSWNIACLELTSLLKLQVHVYSF
jgi:hypothetical protein